jgi:signal transduction histidine kinase
MKETNIEELQQILSSVRQALARIENQEYLAGQPFGLLLEELRDLWEGTADVSWTIDSLATSQLEQDLGLARCSFEVIRESVTNAVKHGSASSISIALSTTENVLRLSITNNGSMTENQQGSLGSELMDQLCLSRDLTFENGLVVLRAELALTPVAQQSLV